MLFVVFFCLFCFWLLAARARAANKTIEATIKISVCGNEVKEGGEDCDNTDLDNQTCVTLGYGPGDLSCDPDCSFNLSQCSPVPTATPTPSATPTPTLGPTAAPTPISAATPTPTAGPTSTPASAATSTPAPTAVPTPIEIRVTLVPVPTLPPPVSIFDLDESGKIETTEIYEVIRLWVDDWKDSLLAMKNQATEDWEEAKEKLKEKKKCDINRDQECNLFDFSLLLYYINNS
jgi:hypothetical protein